MTSLRPDALIAGYRVIRPLGSGGMGEVYLVQHPRLPRRDALKLLDATVSRNDEFRDRFTREAEVLAPLSHPNIVTLYDRGEADGRLWLTMEYVDGADAAALVRERGPLPVGLALDVIAGVGAALDFAWLRHRLTHRDVKPANVLIELADGAAPIVKLADFGIAKAAAATTSLTSTGVTIGTMAYLAPEAIEGGVIDNRADLYSLACTAYQLLTGATPFTGETAVILMNAHLSRPAPAITQARPDLPAHFDGVFRRALAKNPKDRFADAAEFVAALRAGATAEPATVVLGPNAAPTALQLLAAAAAPFPGPTVPTPRRSRALGLVGALAAVMLVAAVAFGALWFRAEDRVGTARGDATATQQKLDGLQASLADKAKAEEVAGKYAKGASTFDYRDLNPWHTALTTGVSDELKNRLTPTFGAMNQLLVPLQWVSTSTLLDAVVASTKGSIYAVNVYVEVNTTTVQIPAGRTTVTVYNVTMDKSKDWQITDVGGAGNKDVTTMVNPTPAPR